MKVTQKAKKYSPLGVFVLLLFIAFSSVAIIKVFSEEDTWICENGEWVRHGNPFLPKPKSYCPSSISNAQNREADPKETVESFYNWYLQYEGNPISSGAYKTSDYLSDNFKKEIDSLLSGFEGGGYDPILLAQDFPSSFEVSVVSVNNDQASVAVEMEFYGMTQSVEINLVKSGKLWQIDKIFRSSEASSSTGQSDQSVTIYFNNPRRSTASGSNDCGVVYGVERIISEQGDIYQAALEQLFQGPSNAEKAQGYTSFFTSETRSILKSVKVNGFTAYVDLADIRSLIPNASSSCGSAELLSQIEETLKHDRKITKVIIAIDGNPQTFYDWVQIGCNQENGNCDATPFSDE